MPTYEYRCKRCEHEFEEFQSMTAPVLKKCPSCGKNALERLIGTGAAVVFKGSGFYQTDYRSESYRKAAEAEKAPAASAGDSKSTPATSSEAKPSQAAETKPSATTPSQNSSQSASPPDEGSRSARRTSVKLGSAGTKSSSAKSSKPGSKSAPKPAGKR